MLCAFGILCAMLVLVLTRPHAPQIQGAIHHFKITPRPGGRLAVGEKDFGGLGELVAWFRHEPIYIVPGTGLGVPLGQPYTGAV